MKLCKYCIQNVKPMETIFDIEMAKTIKQMYDIEGEEPIDIDYWEINIDDLTKLSLWNLVDILDINKYYRVNALGKKFCEDRLKVNRSLKHINKQIITKSAETMSIYDFIER